jgi:hypothetical protein
MRLRAIAALTLAGLALASCDSGGSPKEVTKLQVKTQADAERDVEQLAGTVATAVGSKLENWTTNPSPCENPAGVVADGGPWNLSGFANIAVKPADQVPTLTRLRDEWTRQGYTVTEFHLVPPGDKQGRLAVRTPATDMTISLQSTAPGTAFAVIVSTPCYAPAPGEHPGS